MVGLVGIVVAVGMLRVSVGALFLLLISSCCLVLCEPTAPDVGEASHGRHTSPQPVVPSEQDSTNTSYQQENAASSPSVSQMPVAASRPSSSGQENHDVTTLSKRVEPNSPLPSAESDPGPSPALDQVFVPLKEWKQRKLEALESKARRIQTTPTVQLDMMPVRRDTGQTDNRSYHGPVVIPDNLCPAARVEVLVFLGIAPQRCMPYTLAQSSVWNQGFCGSNEECDETIVESTRPNNLRTDSIHEPKIEHVSDELEGVISEREADGLSERNDQTSDVGSTGAQNGEESFLIVFGPSVKPAASYNAIMKHQVRASTNQTESSNETMLAALANGGAIQLASSFEAWFRNETVGTLMNLHVLGDFVRYVRTAASSLHTESRRIHAVDRTPAPIYLQMASARARKPSGHADLGKIQEQKTHDLKGDELVLDLSEALKISADSKDSHAVPERPFNFASADAGARILGFSKGMVGANNVITGSVDKYSLAPCDGDGVGGSRWIDIELSEEVQLESIEVANLEYYSSSAQRIAVLGAKAYPTKQWNIIGVFDFADVRTMQRFQIENKLFTRFLRVMFAGKQGNEYYCPISTIQAFGKTLIADLKDMFDAPRNSGKLAMDHSARNEGLDRSQASASRKESDPILETDCSRHSPSNDAKHKVADTKPSGDQGPAISSASPEDRSISSEMEDSKQQTLGVVPGTADDHVGSDSQSSNEKTASTPRALESNPSGHASTGGEMRQGNVETADEENNDAMSEEDQLVLEAVREHAQLSGLGDDNIFRKVTKMLRMLELNQTLTNQYIDTHLSRFAAALSNVQHESKRAQDSVALTEKRMTSLMTSMDSTMREFRSAALKRDIIICVLVVCLAFLLGTHWVLWMAVSGTKLHVSESELEMNYFETRQESLSMTGQLAQESDHDVQSPIEGAHTIRQRRKSLGEIGITDLRKQKRMNGDWEDKRERSASSTELPVVSRGQSKSSDTRCQGGHFK